MSISMVFIRQPFLVSALALLFTFFTSQTFANYIEVTLLGTGTPRPSLERFGPSTLVQAKGRYFLFDSGRGATIRLTQAGVPLSQIEYVFLTHLHSDHISGLSDLSLTSWIWQRPTTLKLTGPTGTENLAKHLNQAYEADFDYRTKNTGLNPKTFDIHGCEISSEGVIYEQDGITITAFLVDHHPVEPAYGYRIDYGDASVVISGDTTYSKNLIKYAENVDLLIHEVAAANPPLLVQNVRLNKVLSYHTTPEQAGKLFNLVQPKAAVYNHILLFGIDEESVLETTRSFFQGKVRIGHDLMKIGVGETITFY
jgi:ribonuclease Z